MRTIFAQHRRSRKGKCWNETGEGETQVDSLTFPSLFHAFVAVGTLAKCVVFLFIVTGESSEESGATFLD
jgi:hypothetical protein